MPRANANQNAVAACVSQTMCCAMLLHLPDQGLTAPLRPALMATPAATAVGQAVGGRSVCTHCRRFVPMKERYSCHFVADPATCNTVQEGKLMLTRSAHLLDMAASSRNVTHATGVPARQQARLMRPATGQPRMCLFRVQSRSRSDGPSVSNGLGLLEWTGKLLPQGALVTGAPCQQRAAACNLLGTTGNGRLLGLNTGMRCVHTGQGRTTLHLHRAAIGHPSVKSLPLRDVLKSLFQMNHIRRAICIL